MRSPLRWLAAGVFWLSGMGCPLAAPVASPDVPSLIAALSRAHAAVVGVQVSATDGARSGQTLGQRRSGSGVVIDADGLILTIGYLLLEAQSIQITTQDNRTLPARPIAYDQATGFGLIRTLLPLGGISPVPMGSLQDSEIGDALMVTAGPRINGNDSAVTMTQLVSKRSFSGYWEYHIDAAAFTSPPIERHSGAPLFNQKGELIGIGSLLVMDALGNNQRLPGNMFVPIDLLKPVLDEMQRTGSSKQSHRPWLGLNSSDQDGRVQILRVNKDSPAQAAGLHAGDMVLAVEGTQVASLEAFYKKLWEQAQPEVDIRLTVLQGAEIKTIVIKAVDRMSTLLKPAGI